ncbi:MAG: hypothetical protein ACKVQS_10190 [Fimbriimonadaceae bacterium]
MEYMVIGPDGAEYGPANVDTLKVWVSEGRLTADSQLKNFATGQMMVANSVPGLFAAVPSEVPYAHVPPPTAPAAYPRTTGNGFFDSIESSGVFWGIVARCAAALILFFVFHGLGMIFAIYAMVYAVQLKSAGSKYGVIALILAGITLVAVGIGWILRLQGAPV